MPANYTTYTTKISFMLYWLAGAKGSQGLDKFWKIVYVIWV